MPNLRCWDSEFQLSVSLQSRLHTEATARILTHLFITYVYWIPPQISGTPLVELNHLLLPCSGQFETIRRTSLTDV